MQPCIICNASIPAASQFCANCGSVQARGATSLDAPPAPVTRAMAVSSSSPTATAHDQAVQPSSMGIRQHATRHSINGSVVHAVSTPSMHVAKHTTTATDESQPLLASQSSTRSSASPDDTPRYLTSAAELIQHEHDDIRIGTCEWTGYEYCVRGNTLPSHSLMLGTSTDIGKLRNVLDRSICTDMSTNDRVSATNRIITAQPIPVNHPTARSSSFRQETEHRTAPSEEERFGSVGQFWREPAADEYGVNSGELCKDYHINPETGELPPCDKKTQCCGNVGNQCSCLLICGGFVLILLQTINGMYGVLENNDDNDDPYSTTTPPIDPKIANAIPIGGSMAIFVGGLLICHCVLALRYHSLGVGCCLVCETFNLVKCWRCPGRIPRYVKEHGSDAVTTGKAWSIQHLVVEEVRVHLQVDTPGDIDGAVDGSVDAGEYIKGVRVH